MGDDDQDDDEEADEQADEQTDEQAYGIIPRNEIERETISSYQHYSFVQELINQLKVMS